MFLKILSCETFLADNIQVVKMRNTEEKKKYILKILPKGKKILTKFNADKYKKIYDSSNFATMGSQFILLIQKRDTECINRFSPF